MTLQFVVFVFCTVVSAACAALLIRGWRRSRARFVFWCAVAFSFIAVANAILIADLFSAVNLVLLRSSVIAVGCALLIYGLTVEESA